MEQVQLSVAQMGCGGCVRNVREALASVPGVKVERVEVGSASVGYDPQVASLDAILGALLDAGYPAKKEVHHVCH
jgi:copper chaperone